MGGNKGAYEMTANFLKGARPHRGVDQSQGAARGHGFRCATAKGAQAVDQCYQAHSATSKVTLSILSCGALSARAAKRAVTEKYYPEAVAIMAEVTGTQVEKSTPAERNQIHRMHVQYVNAFFSIPLSVRRRSSRSASPDAAAPGVSARSCARATSASRITI